MQVGVEQRVSFFFTGGVSPNWLPGVASSLISTLLEVT